MNQDRLDAIEERVDDLEEGNGWHEWGKHVLKELARLHDGQETLRKDNNNGHKTIYKKLDDYKDADEARLISCNDRFLPAKVFHWLIIVLVVVFGGLFAVGVGHLVSHNESVAAVTQPEKVEVEKPLEDLQKTH